MDRDILIQKCFGYALLIAELHSQDLESDEAEEIRNKLDAGHMDLCNECEEFHTLEGALSEALYQMKEKVLPSKKVLDELSCLELSNDAKEWIKRCGPFIYE